MQRPIIAIPMGDPAGIGAEIIVKALNRKEIFEACKPVVIGDYSVLTLALKICKLNLQLNVINEPSLGKFTHGTIDVIDLHNVEIEQLHYGEVLAMGGKAAYEYIEAATKLAVDKKVNALATAPINKESLKAANVPFIGHTEILAGLTKSYDPLTMFEVRGLRVFFLSRHISLMEACKAVTAEKVYEYIVRCNRALTELKINGGTLAVAGLNPHCGENGLFGNEEQTALRPAIEKAKNEGYLVEGPIGADSVFHLALHGRYSAVLSLYHDQGHIATKTLDFERTISLTLGLPFLRTSVDHGTAFDIAGKGIAGEISMVEAIKIAAKYI